MSKKVKAWAIRLQDAIQYATIRTEQDDCIAAWDEIVEKQGEPSVEQFLVEVTVIEGWDK